MKDKDDTEQIWEAYVTEADDNWTLQSRLDDAAAKATSRREPLHWSTRQQEIKDEQSAAEIDSVTCLASNCVHWSNGNKCVADNIELEGKKDLDLGYVVICNTFLAGDTPEE